MSSCLNRTKHCDTPLNSYLFLNIWHYSLKIIDLFLEPIISRGFVMKLSCPPLLLIKDTQLSFPIRYPAEPRSFRVNIFNIYTTQEVPSTWRLHFKKHNRIWILAKHYRKKGDQTEYYSTSCILSNKLCSRHWTFTCSGYYKRVWRISAAWSYPFIMASSCAISCS